MKKRHVTILCGGQSGEHDISILSATNVLRGLQRSCYVTSVIYIQRDGQWRYFSPDFLTENKLSACLQTGLGEVVALLPGETKNPWLLVSNNKRVRCDCVFPVLHGTSGEDGAPQGLLRMLGVPYVGADILGSVICFAKDVTKAVLYSAGIQTVPSLMLTNKTVGQYSYSDLVKLLGTRMVIKPCSQGSSIGISIVENESDFQAGLTHAFLYDTTVLVEKAIIGREIECAVLGHDEPQTALLGEIKVSSNFYSYEAKYEDSSGVRLIAPASIEDHLLARIQNIAKKAYAALHVDGMARVDFFVTAEEEIFVNEVNTIPGFTDKSLYPKVWEVSGLALPELLDQLIKYALDNFQLLTKKWNKQAEIRLSDAKNTVHTS